MKLYRKIDTKTGNFIEDCLFDDVPQNNGFYSYIEQAPTQGFYLPRWNGSEWVEGGTAPDPQPIEPTEAERLAAVEAALDFLLMGGA